MALTFPYQRVRKLVAGLTSFSLVAQILALVAVSTALSVAAPSGAFAAESSACRSVADSGGGNGGNDLLTVIDTADFNPATNEVSIGTGLGTSNVEANAMNAFTGDLYAINANQMGIVDPVTGEFDSTGFSVVGSGDGADGPQTFGDIDGLTFDPYPGFLWGAVRRDPGLDLLIKINAATGAHIPDAFGPGVDYLEIGASGGNEDIDSLAYDLVTGRLYGAANAGDNDADLVLIDVTDGSVTTIGQTGINDLEGMSIDQFGQMWAVDGTSPYYLYKIDKLTAVSSSPNQINNGGDYESVECRTDFGINTVSGTAFFDVDTSGTYNAGDLPLPGATVTLYRDTNNDGLIDGGDWPLATIDSDGAGFYTFTFAADGNFVIGIDPSDLPPSWIYTTADVHEADFVGLGNSDVGNDFGGTFPDTLDVTKVANPSGTVDPGDTVEYTITVTNNGTNPATDVVVSDPTPVGSVWQAVPGTTITTPVGSSGSFREEFNAISYTENDGDAGYNWKAGWTEVGEDTDPDANDIKVDTDGSFPDYSLLIKKKSKAIWRQADVSAYSSGVLSIDIRRDKVKDSDLAVLIGPTATGPWTTAVAIPGTGSDVTDADYITYTYAFSDPTLFTADFTLRMETGPDGDEDWWFDNVNLEVTQRVVDTFAGDPPSTLAPPAVPPPEMLGATELDLLPGESMTVVFEVVVDDPTAETTLDNTVSVTSDQQLIPLMASTSNPISNPDFTIVKSITDVGGDGPGGSVDAAGDTISYQIVVTNTGTQTLTGVGVSDPLIFDLDCDAVTPGLQTSGFTLALAASLTCTGTYDATQTDIDTDGGGDGDIDNTATGSTDQVADKTDSAAAPIDQTPGISVAKAITDVDGEGAGASVDEAGDTISYEITTSNTGNTTLTNVTVSDPLLGALTCDATTTFGNPFVNGTGSLVVGDSVDCTGTYDATQADIDNNGGGDGDIDNTASATSDEDGPETDSAAAPITQDPDFTITKTITDVGGEGAGASVDEAGDTVSYEMVLTNTGNQTLTGVSIADPLLGALVCAPVQPATLAPGDDITCTGTYDATQTDIDTDGGGDGDIDNTATGSTDQVADKDDSADVPVVQAPDFTITKSVTDVGGEGAGASVDEVGDTISYQIFVTNTGNQTLTGVGVADPLLTDLDCDAIIPGFQTTGFTVAPGADLTCVGTYAATQTDIDTDGGGDGDIDNTATGSTDQVPDKDDSADVPITQDPHFSISKVVTDVGGDGPGGFIDEAGDVVFYEVVLTNTGNVTLTGITLDDSLEPAVTVGAPTESITTNGDIE
ncbi:MAG: DUF7507 domain-containing protein, partial [Acidimicrobiales bacterium]